MNANAVEMKSVSEALDSETFLSLFDADLLSAAKATVKRAEDLWRVVHGDSEVADDFPADLPVGAGHKVASDWNGFESDARTLARWLLDPVFTAPGLFGAADNDVDQRTRRRLIDATAVTLLTEALAGCGDIARSSRRWILPPPVASGGASESPRKDGFTDRAIESALRGGGVDQTIFGESREEIRFGTERVWAMVEAVGDDVVTSLDPKLRAPAQWVFSLTIRRLDWIRLCNCECLLETPIIGRFDRWRFRRAAERLRRL